MQIPLTSEACLSNTANRYDVANKKVPSLIYLTSFFHWNRDKLSPIERGDQEGDRLAYHVYQG